MPRIAVRANAPAAAVVEAAKVVGIRPTTNGTPGQATGCVTAGTRRSPADLSVTAAAAATLVMPKPSSALCRSAGMAPRAGQILKYILEKNGVGEAYAPVMRRMSSCAHFAQRLQPRYNKSISAFSTSEQAVEESQSGTHPSNGRSTVTTGARSAQQSKSHFIVNGQEILVSSTSTLPGYTVTAYKGFVQGSSVQARDMLLMAKVFLLVQLGGEVEDMASLIQRAKREAVERLCVEAAALGGNAVVGVRLVSSGTHQRTAVEFSAYGTAVSVKKHA